MICFHLIHKTRRKKEEITLPNHDDEYDIISICFFMNNNLLKERQSPHTRKHTRENNRPNGVKIYNIRGGKIRNKSYNPI
jgi:hypothetical protein